MFPRTTGPRVAGDSRCIRKYSEHQESTQLQVYIPYCTIVHDVESVCTFTRMDFSFDGVELEAVAGEGPEEDEEGLELYLEDLEAELEDGEGAEEL